jgi:transcriptional regulator with XRE-family HTH domain
MHTLEPKAIGERIRQARDEAGLTQKTVADVVGCTNNDISRYEHGRGGVPQPARVALIAGVLGVSPGWLLFGTPPSDEAAEAPASEAAPAS